MSEKTVLEQIVDIVQSEIDSNYVTDSEYLEDFVEDESKTISIAIGTVDDYEIKTVGRGIPKDSTEEVLGYMFGGRYSYKEYKEYSYEDPEGILDQTDYFSKEDFPVFLFSSFAVKDGYKGNGIGGSVAAHTVRFAKPPYFAGVWARESEKRNISVVEQYGEHIATVPDYYPDDWDCPDCEGRCTCSSKFYAYKP